MNADLEKSLEELGPGCGEVVARLKNACEIECGPGRRATGGSRFVRGSYLAAAALLLVAALAIHFRPVTPDSQRSARHSTPAPREYAMTTAEMIDSQNPDGSWANDFLTRRNAAALRPLTDAASRVAYKKAVRNLRLRGLL